MVKKGTKQIIANLPERLKAPVETAVREERHLSRKNYGLALILWDLYALPEHTTTGPLLRDASWVLDTYTADICEMFGDATPLGDKRMFRFAVDVPLTLMPKVEWRIENQRYKGVSAYLTGLVVYHLNAFGPDRKPRHERTSALLREPEWLQEQVFRRIVTDFNNPDRKWPYDLVPDHPGREAAEEKARQKEIEKSQPNLDLR